MIRIYGASDDLIEILGDWREELSAYDFNGFVLTSDGAVIRVRYDGCWRFHPIIVGQHKCSLVQTASTDDKAPCGPNGESSYSDVIEIDGPVKWVALSESTIAREHGDILCPEKED